MRPTIRTDELVEKVLAMLREGHSIEVSAAKNWVGVTTWHRWCREDPELKAATDQARAEYASLLEDRLDTVDDPVKAKIIQHRLACAYREHRVPQEVEHSGGIVATLAGLLHPPRREAEEASA